MKILKFRKKTVKLQKKTEKNAFSKKPSVLAEVGLFLKEREELFNDKEEYRWKN